MNEDERSDLIQHVRSLNDRYLTRRTSSGFQAWTILAFMAICLLRVVQVIPLAVADSRFCSDVLKITCLELYGAMLVCFVVMSGPVATVYVAQHRSGRILAATPLEAVQDYVRGCGLSVVFLICFCLQEFTSFMTNWSPFMLIWSFLMALFYCLQWTIRSRRRAVRGTQHISSWSSFSHGWWIWMRVLVTVSAAVFWVLACRSSNVLPLDRDGTNLLAAGFPFLGILLGLSALTFVIADSLRDSWLGAFETAVFMENMSTDAIKSGLVDGYLGRDLTSSLEQLSQSWNDAVTRCLSAVDGATKDYINTAMLDKSDNTLPALLDRNKEFLGHLAEYLKNTIQPALSELLAVLGSVLEIKKLEGANTTPETVVFIRTFATRAEQSLGSITTLLRKCLDGVFSDLCATAAGTDQAEPMQEAVNKIRRDLDRLPSFATKRSPARN